MRKAWEFTLHKAQNLQNLHRPKPSLVFPTTSPSHSEESNNESDQQQIEQVDRLQLPNGDLYTGDCLSGRPHGGGVYVWTDGCIYEGDWRFGRANGRGRFTWPTGVNYEGEFHKGFMDGFGRYTSSSGEAYWGDWSTDLKHGHGKKSFPNGDYYDGEWRHGIQEGHGKYVWKNGSEYSGDWKAGMIHGRGVLAWVNGNRYEGDWKDGLPNGSGTFHWPDGSLYVGNWTMEDGKLEQKGTYYPSPEADSIARDPEEDFNVSMSMTDCEVCRGEDMLVLPSKKKLHWSKGHTKSTVSFAVLGDEEEEGSDPAMRWPPREIRRQGQSIRRGHKNYELMLNLQLGIRHAVGKQCGPTTIDLKSSAFDPKEKFWTRFPPEGTKHTPPHQSCDFRWKDYCPMVFRSLRTLFKVDPGDYMLSICGNDALRELSSPGKSGSFFYLTNDDKYFIKTMKKAEVKVLLRMLPAYFKHVRSFENTLVTRFFGLHSVKLIGAAQKKVRFVIMGNLFCCEYPIHRRFDLKGSSHGRTTDKPETEIDETTTLKDLDLNFTFRLQNSWFQEFCRQVDRDCDFLEQERIMDYSLLVGVHFRDACQVTCDAGKIGDSMPLASTSGDDDEFISRPLAPSPILKLGINMPARVEQIIRRSAAELMGEPTGEFHDVVLYFGIIDILQDYDISKKLEHAYKSMQYDPTSISAVDPKLYAKRFRDFIFRVFNDDL